MPHVSVRRLVAVERLARADRGGPEADPERIAYLRPECVARYQTSKTSRSRSTRRDHRIIEGRFSGPFDLACNTTGGHSISLEFYGTRYRRTGKNTSSVDR